MNKIGIDLGGTKIEGILVNESFNEIVRKRIPTNQEQGYDSILKSISELIQDLRTKSTLETKIGICTPGIISKKTGLLKNSNTQCLIGKPLKDDLEKILGEKISMENDANCFALAESTLGAGKDFDVVFGIIMGTGVGGGIIVRKQIHTGRTNIAGEWGHHCIKPDGNSCYCGNSGCIETYVSGPALERYWTKLTYKTEPLQEIVKKLDSETGKRWKEDFIENFALGLANVIDILDPDAIVLGGGVSNIDFLYDEGKNAVYEKVFSDQIDTPILKNELGDSSGVFGACMI
jgi:fructokinase|tara:strand:+ start:851 stop:1720 length:870 start_codon:yes stop_codon:yes gene_type:complete